MKKEINIKLLRKKGLTLEQIGLKQKPVLTAERIRQILDPIKQTICKKHKVLYSVYCDYCTTIYSYEVFLKKVSKFYLLNAEAKRLSLYDRNKGMVLQRSLYVKYLRNIYEYSFEKIANLINRNHSAVINLYYKII